MGAAGGRQEGVALADAIEVTISQSGAETLDELRAAVRVKQSAARAVRHLGTARR